jgi:hypothetical protein
MYHGTIAARATLSVTLAVGESVVHSTTTAVTTKTTA